MRSQTRRGRRRTRVWRDAWPRPLQGACRPDDAAARYYARSRTLAVGSRQQEVFSRVGPAIIVLTVGAMSVDDVPRTKLQPRPIKVVRKLRLRVDAGPAAGAMCAPDDGARLA